MNGVMKQVEQTEAEASTVKCKRKETPNEDKSNKFNLKSSSSKSSSLNDFFNDDKNKGAEQSCSNHTSDGKQIKCSSEKSKQLEVKTRIVNNGKVNKLKQSKRLKTSEKLPKVNKEVEVQLKDTFLDLLRNEDRNDDGTVKSDAIQRLELKNCLLLQY